MPVKTSKPRSQRHLNSPQYKARRLSAGARQEAAAQRSPEEQLKRLDDLLGEGQGAKKERARLAARIAAAAKAAAPKPEKKAKKVER